MTSMVGLNIVIAAALGVLALVCAIASLSLRRNVPLAWLAGGLTVGTVQTLILTFAAGSPLEYFSAMALAPLGFLFANNAIHALMPQSGGRRHFLAAFAGLSAVATALFVLGAPFFYQALFVQAACTLAMIDAALRIARTMKWRLLDTTLLASVGILALLRVARIPLLIWYFGPEAAFSDFNGSSVELTLLAVESLLTLAIITLVIAAIIGETIATFRHQSERDGLTGLLNRRALDALANIPARKAGTVILCDIDHFKLVNDRFGHQAGDDVICTLANILNRTGYPAVRIGGEEFALLLPERSMQDALDLAEMVRARLQASSHPGLPVDERITASFGVAEYAVGATPASSFSNADAALYLAKNAGRNRVMRAGESEKPLPSRHAA
ncbi:GGDEF domain-containing protein [Devosia sp. SL43]|uniref:GGDEF domain-containing protein n=1 Tax=Devosia sp. SL43 TaxID=2806348 RepID=UPI001F3D98BE|nr:GGDEF domain-containing protein [Devosia sp. SL43]UJW85273.1 GGDEF domain-containing protein [Devosia sp. SL43]